MACPDIKLVEIIAINAKKFYIVLIFIQKTFSLTRFLNRRFWLGHTFKNFSSFNTPNPRATYTRRTPSQSIHLSNKLRYKQKKKIKG